MWYYHPCWKLSAHVVICFVGAVSQMYEVRSKLHLKLHVNASRRASKRALET